MTIIYTNDEDLPNGGSLAHIQGAKYEGWLRNDRDKTQWWVCATKEEALADDSDPIKVFDFDPRFENFEEEVIEAWFETGHEPEPEYAELASTQPPDHITISWHISDVKSVREDLTDEQCREVLSHVKGNLDANEGVTWETLEFHAARLFGDEK